MENKSLACRVCRAGKYCRMCHKSNECGSRCSTPKSCLEGLQFMELVSRGLHLRVELAPAERDLFILIGTPASDCNFKGALGRADAEMINTALAAIEGKHEVKTKELALRRRLKVIIQNQGGNEMGKAEVKAMDEAIQIGEAKAVAAKEELEQFKASSADREQRIAEAYEVAGRIQGLAFVEKVATVATLVQLSKVKESKVYRDLPGIGTWDNYCEYLGLSRRKVDEDLQNLADFGEQFLATVANFSLGYREMRKLRQLTHDGSVTIDAESVRIGEEEIPLDQTEELQTAIERIIAEKAQIKEEADKSLKAKDRVLRDKEKVINDQARKLSDYEGKAKAKGLTADEDAFLQRMQNARIAIDGFLSDFDTDKDPLPVDATPRMHAAYLETIGYFRRIVMATYDDASDRYGTPDLDDDWVPPHLRDDAAEMEKHHKEVQGLIKKG